MSMLGGGGEEDIFENGKVRKKKKNAWVGVGRNRSVFLLHEW